MNVIQEHRCCANCGAVEVQHLTPQGWQACSPPLKTRSEAETYMEKMVKGKTEFRIYCALDRREEK